MRFLLRLLSYLLLLPLLLWIVYLNVQLYHQPRYKMVDGISVHAGLQAQLAWLSDALPAGGRVKMQAAYPQGALMSQALSGLAACDLLAASPVDSRVHGEALSQVDAALAWLRTPEAREPYEADLPLPYGAAYHGWSSYLLARKLAALPAASRPREDILRLQEACDLIAQTWVDQGHPYPESRSGEAWATDGMLCAATVALYEQLYPGRYTPSLATWIEQVETRLDSLGMIPRAVDATDGSPLTLAQGQSQGLALVLLGDIAPKLAESQYRRYRELFLTTRLGLPAIRQYPKGSSGNDDPAAGPTVWGVSGAASVVGVRALARYGAQGEALALRNVMEGLGLGFHWQGEKRYWLGLWPMLDAWMAWDAGVEADATQRLTGPADWRWTFHLISLGTILFLILGLILIHRATRARPPQAGEAAPTPSTPSESAATQAPTAKAPKKKPAGPALTNQRRSPDPPTWELPG
jgi:hypothetical protein